jgi:VCBS repeat protein
MHTANGVATAVALGGFAMAAAAQPGFVARVVEPHATGDCKAVADFDGDGLDDIVLGGRRRLAWYHAPEWTPRMIAGSFTEFTTDMKTGDVDGDGDADLIIPEGQNGLLTWFENPRPSASPVDHGWVRRRIGVHGTWAHDVEVAPLGPDGRLGVVTRGFGINKVWVHQANGKWGQIRVSNRPGEGTGLGDIDGDGDVDIAISGVWLENPGGNMAGPWPEHAFAAGWSDRVGVRVANINADRRPDIVLSEAESTGRMAWYEAPADPRNGVWIEHVIDPSVDFVHTFQVVDVNKDGRLDIVFGEMAQSERKRVGYFINPGGTGPWPMTVISTAGTHNIRVGDVNNDGNVDIVGANWQAPPMTAWINLSGLPSEVCYANCDGSTAVPIVNVADFDCFMARFNAGDARANCDGSSGTPLLTIQDVICFQEKFAAGCP